MSIDSCACKQTTSAGRLAESLDCVAQLHRRGRVFRVEHRDEFPAHERQCDVQGSRLGSGPPLRGRDDFIDWRKIESLKRQPGRVVVRFNDEFNVEFGAWIIAALGSKLTTAYGDQRFSLA